MSAILAAGDPQPDCVFAVTDVMALGALARLRAGGLEVPADIALAGFDDIATLRDVYPPLTTVRLPLKRMGEMAANLVLSDPSGATRPAQDRPHQDRPHQDRPAQDRPRQDRPRVIPVPGEVILRDSTVPHPPPT
jgi:DNA-binding LacI/PurR family transcriptional regulator